jgi:hypothetical protein
MKTYLCILAFLAIGSNAFGQLSSLPPSSVIDGISISHIGLNAGSTHWDKLGGLGAYRVSSFTDGYATLPAFVSTFVSTPPAALLAQKVGLNSTGGFIRAIFLGESAGWLNDFGYTYDSDPSSPGSFTVFSNIQANVSSLYPVDISFGDYVDISMPLGIAASFDFWLNGVGGNGPVNPATPTTNGGGYTMFNNGGSSPNIPPGNVLYLQEPLMVSTWAASLGIYQDTATYIVGFEDSRLDHPIDRDYSDLIMGFQFFVPDLQHFDPPPVPEPASYACFATCGLLALMIMRSLRLLRQRVRD